MSNNAALRRGRVVDIQVQDWCTAIRAGRRFRPSGGHRIHPYTARLIRVMTKTWHWKPVATQIGITVSRWRLSTRADLLVRNGSRYILVEIKTTTAQRHWAHDSGARFYAPFGQVVSCPLNHARAQLAVTMAMARRDRRSRPWNGLPMRIDAAYVVLVTKTSVVRYRMPRWCGEIGASVAKRLDRRYVS